MRYGKTNCDVFYHVFMKIMRLYEDIIRERSLKSGDRKSMLLDLERSRAYQLRINQLMADIRDFDSKIGSLDGRIGGLDADYRNKVKFQ